MDNINTTEEVEMSVEMNDYKLEKPGVQLMRARESKGYSQEYVAAKLHLRVKIIDCLEVDDYSQMPELVFIKGYLRSYAKLIGLEPEPLLAYLDTLCLDEVKITKALWQNCKEPQKGIWLRWLTGLLMFSVIIIFSIWWYKDKQVMQNIRVVSEEVKSDQQDPSINLTDLSKMHAILSAKQKKGSMELYSG